MSATIKLSEIDFGKDTAEFDRALSEYFVTTEAYREIRAGSKSLVIGRKGTGKTAALKYLRTREDQDDIVVVAIEGSDEALAFLRTSIQGVIATAKEAGIDVDLSFKHAWLCVTLVALGDVAVKRLGEKLFKGAPEVAKYVRRVPKKTSLLAELATFLRGILKVRFKVKSVEFEASIEPKAPQSKTDESFVPLVSSEAVVLEAIAWLAEVLGGAYSEKPFVFFDKLDERWDASEWQIGLIQGLLLATKQLVSNDVPLSPIVLLRNDIFRRATENFQHLDHFRSQIELIRWDEPSLVQLLAARINRSLRASGVLAEEEVYEDSDAWHAIFEPTLAYKSSKIPVTAYLIERTLARPRDLILFANLAKSEALRKDPKATVIREADIRRAEDTFSETKLEDLVAELSVEFPNARDLIEVFRGHTIGIEKADLDQLCQQALNVHGRTLPWIPRTVNELIKWYFQIGLICYTEKGGYLKGTRVVHSGLVPTDDQILRKPKFYVSPIFRRALKTKEKKG